MYGSKRTSKAYTGDFSVHMHYFVSHSERRLRLLSRGLEGGLDLGLVAQGS